MPKTRYIHKGALWEAEISQLVCSTLIPRPGFFYAFIDQKQIKEDKRRESIAFGEWKVNIRNIMDICSCSKADAIKIDIDANDPIWSIKDYGLHQAVESYVFSTGIGWDKQTELMEILNVN